MSTPIVVSMMREVLTALRADLGDNDLSTVGGTVRVDYADAGLEKFPTKPPWIALTAPVVRATYGQAALGEYQLDGSFEWFAWANAATLDVAARVEAALQLGHEIITALQNAHANASVTTLHGSFSMFVAEVVDVFADGPELRGGPPYVHGRVTFQSFASRGL